jgi:hypothetical protein
MTDYNLPPDWSDLSDDEKCQWYTQERCRRQALRQRTRLDIRDVRTLEHRARRIEQLGDTE